MKISQWIEKLKEEGYEDVRVCPLPPNDDFPEHTHDEHTVHVILNGELTITDVSGSRVYKEGERVEFPPGSSHKARGSIDNGKMIVGVKRDSK